MKLFLHTPGLGLLNAAGSSGLGSNVPSLSRGLSSASEISSNGDVGKEEEEKMETDESEDADDADGEPTLLSAHHTYASFRAILHALCIKIMCNSCYVVKLVVSVFADDVHVDTVFKIAIR